MRYPKEPFPISSPLPAQGRTAVRPSAPAAPPARQRAGHAVLERRTSRVKGRAGSCAGGAERLPEVGASRRLSPTGVGFADARRWGKTAGCPPLLLYLVASEREDGY